MLQPRPLIVVADDNEYLLELVESRLQGERWDVLRISDGAAVEKILKSKTVSVLVLDIEMPGMSGLEILSRLKGNHNTSRLPVIMLTGRRMSTDVQEARRLGAAGYITKPFDLEDLVRRIRRLLETGPSMMFL